MAYVISSECISCGICEKQCSVSAIRAGAEYYEINNAECIECGACVETCPARAIRES
ncbi:MAG: 4Fe-4S binding protein [Firmicutes bacterium]|nr:4Fe-4S binding protein [Bacillota bacterium]